MCTCTSWASVVKCSDQCLRRPSQFRPLVIFEGLLPGLVPSSQSVSPVAVWIHFLNLATEGEWVAADRSRMPMSYCICPRAANLQTYLVIHLCMNSDSYICDGEVTYYMYRMNNRYILRTCEQPCRHIFPISSTNVAIVQAPYWQPYSNSTLVWSLHPGRHLYDTCIWSTVNRPIKFWRHSNKWSWNASILLMFTNSNYMSVCL